MNKEKAIDKTMVARAVVSKIKDETKPDQIRAKELNEYESPNGISLRGKNEVYAPDIAAVYKDKTHVYEIELNKHVSVDKWRLFSLYAKKNHGNLYLVVPDYLKENVKKELVDNDINAGLIYFNT
jgi:hypothetical protein